MSLKFIEAQKPLIKCLKFFGFFFYNIEDSAWSSSVKLKVYCVLANTFSVIPLVFNLAYSIEGFVDFLGDGNNVTFMCHALEVLSTEFMASIIIYIILATKAEQIEFFTMLESVENELRNLPFTKCALEEFYRRMKINTLVTVVGLIGFIALLLMTYSIIFGDISHVIQVAFVLSFTAYVMFITMFMHNLSLTVEKFYNVINLALRAFVEKPELYLREISVVLNLHHKLTFAIEVFNESFGVLVFGIFVFSFGTLTIELFFGYVIIYTSLMSKSLVYLFYCIANLLWMVPFISMLQLIGCISSRIQEEVAESQRIVKACSFDKINVKFVNQHLLCSLQADHKLTANGLFVIDRSLIFNVSNKVKRSRTTEHKF